ncbi:MAG: histidinol dehydrogenase, partial [Sedimentisphaerales bacterium]|nr:histidinol dehydrogenase [Sedimentisphaerales bacterium]
GALAWGTESVGRVDKIVGPGNIWGQLAKKEVFGLVDIDSFAGPSDVLVLADESAKPAYVAADLLSQAEHAPGSSMLITNSMQLAQGVSKELSLQIEQLGRAEATRKCITEDSLIVVGESMSECIDLANDFAAEHLQIQCKEPDVIAGQIINAGAIFIGQETPVACGDYYAGPSHTLPTGGSAKLFGPLNVNDFLRQSSIISYDKNSLKKAAANIETIARVEGLDAHSRSVSIRL